MEELVANLNQIIATLDKTLACMPDMTETSSPAFGLDSYDASPDGFTYI